MEKLITESDEITAAWLTQVLGLADVSDVAVEPVGTGQMSRSLRVSYREDGSERHVVVKIAASDPTSRATGVGLGAYMREVAFYQQLGNRLSGAVPRCHLAEYDSENGFFTLVLEDAAPATVGDQIAGCSSREARLALSALAQIQAPVLGDHVLGGADWLNLPNPLTQELYGAVLPGFLERYAARIAPEHRQVCERFGERLGVWLADRRAPLGLVHGDFRLDNLLFKDERCLVVDWQTVTWGPALLDASYYLGGSLTVEDRQRDEQDLVRHYYEELRAAGGSTLTWEQCWEEYRRQAFFGVLMTVIASMIVQQTPRGDEMFMTMLSRHAQHVLDVDTFGLMPAGEGQAVAALQPNPEDEGLHEPGPEQLWNESWYFDAVSDDGTLGIYLRLGRLPNRNECFYTLCICGPERPSLMLALEAPLPAANDPVQAVRTEQLHAEHHCEARLRRYRVTLDAVAEAHEDPAAHLRGEAGSPVPIALDLVWETDGIPYAWRLATRYEIPCRVTGTVRIGEEQIEFTGPGQRDHSWGVRDWWQVDWMWSALHLEDGTRLHAVGVPAMPAHGVGYIQSGETIAELDRVEMAETILPDGLIADASIELHPAGLRLAIEPLAYGPLRLEAPDGRLSLFPRAMCRVTTADGRHGTGWVEWNRVQRPSSATVS